MRNQLTALAYGWVTVFSLIFASSLIVALLLRFTSFNEPALGWTTLGIGIVSLFIGGIFAGAKGKMKGWLMGAAVGLGFTSLSFLIQYLGLSTTFSGEQALYHLFYLLAAMLGGIIGVNTAGPRTNESY